MSTKTKNNKLETQVGWIVLGMHRSGTSAYANLLLHSMGAMPPETPLPPTEETPEVYQESKRLLVTHELVLENLMSSWSDWRSLILNDAAPDLMELCKDQVRATFHSEFDFLDNALIKDPGICRFSSTIKSIMANISHGF